MKEPLDVSVLMRASLHSPGVCMHSTYFAYRIQSRVVIEMSSSYIYLIYLFLHYFYATSKWAVWESKCQSWGTSGIAHLHPSPAMIKKSGWYWLWQRGEQSTLSMQVHASHLAPRERWYFCLNFLAVSSCAVYCGTASRLLGRHSGKYLPLNIINKQLQQILVIMHHWRLKNGKGKMCFFNQHTAGIQTSVKRDPSRAEPRAVSSCTLSVPLCPKSLSPWSQWPWQVCWQWPQQSAPERGCPNVGVG